jgi:hypothetical protein
MRNIFYSVSIVVVVQLMQIHIAHAETTLLTIETAILDVLGSVAPILIGGAVVFFLWSALKFFKLSQSDEERTQAKAMMVYGVIAITVMVSIWGIIAILGDILQLDDTKTINDFQEIILDP